MRKLLPLGIFPLFFFLFAFLAVAPVQAACDSMDSGASLTATHIDGNTYRVTAETNCTQSDAGIGPNGLILAGIHETNLDASVNESPTVDADGTATMDVAFSETGNWTIWLQLGFKSDLSPNKLSGNSTTQVSVGDTTQSCPGKAPNQLIGY